MKFKKWIESEDVFSHKQNLQKEKNIGSILGFKSPLIKVKEGTFATIYQHPKEKNKLIKITSHEEDVKNLLKCQNIKSDNVVKIFPWSKKEKIKNLPNFKSYAIIVEKIEGTPMVYSTPEFYQLGLNGKFELAKDWLNSGGKPEQNKILERHQKNNMEEQDKLSDLFHTLNTIKKFYRIDLVDFQDNILEEKNRYVIVDMGY